MKITLISFTLKGSEKCRNIADLLSQEGHTCHAYGMKEYAQKSGIFPLETNLSNWTKEAFEKYDALVFVGAVGIAVRAIAPYIKSKSEDPAVIVIDEKGENIISLLSGHIGGGNKLTKQIAEKISGRPIITTATDMNHRFAIDQWAHEENLYITDMKLAKEISAAILNEQTIGFESDYLIHGQLPLYITCINKNQQQNEENFPLGFSISIKNKNQIFKKTLLLIPRIITLGIGCRKNTPMHKIKSLVDHVLSQEKILPQAIEQICSIDLKKEEPGIMELSKSLQVPFKVYSSDELKSVIGEFTSSKFVNQITGVDNVCERAAVYGSNGLLLVKKCSQDGVTVALAERSYKICFHMNDLK